MQYETFWYMGERFSTLFCRLSQQIPAGMFVCVYTVLLLCGEKQLRDIYHASIIIEAIPDRNSRALCSRPVSYTHLDVYKRQANWLSTI